MFLPAKLSPGIRELSRCTVLVQYYNCRDSVPYGRTSPSKIFCVPPPQPSVNTRFWVPDLDNKDTIALGQAFTWQIFATIALVTPLEILVK